MLSFSSIFRIGGLLACVLLLAASSGCGGGESSSSEEERANQGSQVAAAHSHSEAGETCFICDASKREPGRLWCSEHARYEDRCWICQPQLEDKSRLYCAEHALYEDECFLCHPELKETDNKTPVDESSSSSLSPSKDGASTDLFCNEHRVPELECGICQPQRTAELMPGEELKVRFESAEAATKAGLRTSSPEASEAQIGVSAVCEVRYNENAVARITPLAPGIVRRVLVDVGSEVEAGAVLVELHSAEIAAARTAFVSAAVDAELKKVSFEREQGLAAKKISSKKDLQEAAAAHRTAELALSTARQRLLNYGLSGRDIVRIEETSDASATLLVRAPFAGTLVERDAVVGEVVEPGTALFTLADLSTMWLSLSVPADGAQLLESGLVVEATMSGISGLSTRGELTWVNTSIDERSRMVRARAVVPNQDRRLKAGMFGEGQILLSSSGPVLNVHVDAVQYFENQPYVFVKHAEDLYGLRRVVVARSSDNVFAVTAGLSPDEPVIVEGAFTAMSEFLKSRLGAGCVDD
jgi:cobalt-zinc-cadmium efflux system membrane fusion protein